MYIPTLNLFHLILEKTDWSIYIDISCWGYTHIPYYTPQYCIFWVQDIKICDIIIIILYSIYAACDPTCTSDSYNTITWWLREI